MPRLAPFLIGQQAFDFSRPYIMGIVNLTPDSFSDGGQFLTPDLALRQIEKMIAEGADLIDLGAASSRPGAPTVSVAEEIQRLTPVLKVYKKYFATPLSLDTFHHEVAEFGLQYGVDLINDISAFEHDPKMVTLVQKQQVPVVLMHKQGSPATMQQQPVYQDVVAEVLAYLQAKVAFCQAQKITKIILDPGIGFGKTLAHNLALLRDLAQFTTLGQPILIGTSRKSFLGQITGADVHNRLAGTLASNLSAVAKGANFLRVHDVAALKNALLVAAAVG